MFYVMSANRLSDGSVVYLTSDGKWSHFFRDAKVLNEEERSQALSAGQFAEDNNLIVGSYMVAVSAAGLAHPSSLRERIRSFGPTVDGPKKHYTVGDCPARPVGGPED